MLKLNTNVDPPHTVGARYMHVMHRYLHKRTQNCTLCKFLLSAGDLQQFEKEKKKRQLTDVHSTFYKINRQLKMKIYCSSTVDHNTVDWFSKLLHFESCGGG